MVFVFNVLDSNGDSGGPLLLYVNGFPRLVGVTSFMVRCSQTGMPSVFTRTSAVMKWLKRTPAVFYTETGVYGERLGKCRFGEYMYRLSGRVQFCRACGGDEWSNGGSVTRCTRCLDGFRRDERNGGRCACVGVFAVGRGIKDGKCELCDVGWYSGRWDQKCIKCPIGKTTEERGAERCEWCGSGGCKGTE